MKKIDVDAVKTIEDKLDFYRHSFSEGMISKETYESLKKHYSTILKQLKGVR